MSDRKIIHTRTTSSSEPKVVAEFVHNLTLQGYEPLYNQTRKNFGTFIITMALYESKEGEAKAPVVEAKIEEPKLTVDVAPEVKTEAKTKASTKRVGKAKDTVATPAEASGDAGSDTSSSSDSE